MNIRETELKIMEILWENGPTPAGKLYKILEEKIGWKRSTTYTVLQKCIEKGFVERDEPGFICRPLIERDAVQKAKISDLMSVFFGNSKKSFLNAFFKSNDVTEKDIQELRDYVEQLQREMDEKNNP